MDHFVTHLLNSPLGLILPSAQLEQNLISEGKFLFTKFELGGSFGISFEGGCHEVEVTPNLELFWCELGGSLL